MLESPSILALLLVSALSAAIVVYGSLTGAGLLIRWDSSQSTEAQLLRERKTYLVSTILNHVMVVKLFSLFLFIAIADQIRIFLTGAMCAAGSLNANPYGYTALFLILSGFICSVLWLLLNHIDSKSHDFPLLRLKYFLLIGITPLFLAEFYSLFRYFISLNPELITSCCGSIFSGDSQGLAAELVHTPVLITVPVFWFFLLITIACGILYYCKGDGWNLFPLLSIAMLPIAVVSIISFISLYIYQLPTHHCPFCLLQVEYNYIGYFLYASILLGSLLGTGTGIVHHFSRVESLSETLQPLKQKLCAASLFGYFVFGLLVGRSVFFSDLRLFL